MTLNAAVARSGVSKGGIVLAYGSNDKLVRSALGARPRDRPPRHRWISCGADAAGDGHVLVSDRSVGAGHDGVWQNGYEIVHLGRRGIVQDNDSRARTAAS